MTTESSTDASETPETTPTQPTDEVAPRRGWKVFAVLFSLVTLAATVSPVGWTEEERDRDSFPLTSYPMFSHGRPSPELTIVHAVGIRADGHREPLTPRQSAGTFEVLQSMRTMEIATYTDPNGFCQEMRERVLAGGETDFVSLELVTESWDAVAYFEDEEDGPDRDGYNRHVHARCEVQP